jgi:hypothetical protein
MKNRSNSSNHGLSLGQTLVICGFVFVLYKIFRSPELDREIRKVEAEISA